MKALRTPLFALVLVAVLLSLSIYPAQSAPTRTRIPRYQVGSIGLVDQYMLQSNRLWIHDNLLYSAYTHFAIADISNPDQIRIVDRIYTRYVYDFVIDGQYAYTAMQDLGVQNLDILVNVISEFTKVNLKSSALGVSLADGVLYAANGPKGVRMLDAKKPGDLTPWGEGIKAPGNSVGVTAAGNIVYIASAYDGVRIYDTTDRQNPVELSVVDTPGYTNTITVDKNLAYVADGPGGVRILDVTDPKKPVELGFFDTPGTAKRILLNGQYAYVADGESGLTILDVSNPRAPSQVTFYRTNGSVVDVALKDNLIFAANMPNGILVLTWTPPVKKDGLDQGGTLESTADRVTYTVPAGSVPAGSTCTHQALYRASVPDGDEYHVKVGPFFSLYGTTPKGTDTALASPIKISAGYDANSVPANREAALGLYYWQGSMWVIAPDSKVDPQMKTVSGTVDNFTLYGVFYDRRFRARP